MLAKVRPFGVFDVFLWLRSPSGRPPYAPYPPYFPDVTTWTLCVERPLHPEACPAGTCSSFTAITCRRNNVGSTICEATRGQSFVNQLPKPHSGPPLPSAPHPPGDSMTPDDLCRGTKFDREKYHRSPTVPLCDKNVLPKSKLSNNGLKSIHVCVCLSIKSCRDTYKVSHSTTDTCLFQNSHVYYSSAAHP